MLCSRMILSVVLVALYDFSIKICLLNAILSGYFVLLSDLELEFNTVMMMMMTNCS